MSDAIDFSRYGLDGLREEILELINVAAAIKDVIKTAALGGFAVAVISTIVALLGMGTGWALLFGAIAGILALPLGAAVGGWLLARRRVATVSRASDLVVDAIGEMHADVARVRAGAAETSVHDIAVGLLEEGVLPIVFGSISQTAEGLMGPFSFLAERATKVPMAMVERTVISAVRSLPDRQIGDLVEGTVDKVTPQALSTLAADYTDVRGRIDGLVGKIGSGVTLAGGGAVALAAVPVLVWWVIGWLVA